MLLRNRHSRPLPALECRSTSYAGSITMRPLIPATLTLLLLALTVEDVLAIFTPVSGTITISSGTAAALLGGLGALKLGESSSLIIIDY